MPEEIFKIEHRVYYNETDNMGRVYHSNFLFWMEKARTEYIRSRGISYKELEEKGILLPVKTITVNYENPVEYDEIVIIFVKIKNITRIKIEFLYEFFSGDMSKKFGDAYSANVFSGKNGKLARVDKDILKILKQNT